jgi:hypothetical protein
VILLLLLVQFVSDVVVVVYDGWRLARKSSGRELNRTVGKKRNFRQLSNVAESTRLLPKCLAVHNRGRSLDMISPGLRICIETARARTALAGPSPGETRARKNNRVLEGRVSKGLGKGGLKSHVDFGRPVAGSSPS